MIQFPPIPTQVEEVPAFLETFVSQVQEAITNIEVESIVMTTLHVEPAKYEDGTMVKADGTNWDPGSGAGVYVWNGAAWTKLTN